MRQTPRYPIGLEIVDRRCVIIGGGHVASRKLASLHDCGAFVHVISPDVCPGIAAAASDRRVTIERREYRPGDLRDAFLAIAATNVRAVNAAVAAEAHASNVLVTVCDDPAAGNVAGLATIRRGNVMVAIGTEGESPTLARMVREDIERLLTPEYADLLELVAAERQAARATGRPISAEAWRAAVTPEILALMRAGRCAEAAARLRLSLGETPACIAQGAGS